jgi:hypothetical protein
MSWCTFFYWNILVTSVLVWLNKLLLNLLIKLVSCFLGFRDLRLFSSRHRVKLTHSKFAFIRRNCNLILILNLFFLIRIDLFTKSRRCQKIKSLSIMWIETDHRVLFLNQIWHIVLNHVCCTLALTKSLWKRAWESLSIVYGLHSPYVFAVRCNLFKILMRILLILILYSLEYLSLVISYEWVIDRFWFVFYLWVMTNTFTWCRNVNYLLFWNNNLTCLLSTWINRIVLSWWTWTSITNSCLCWCRLLQL